MRTSDSADSCERMIEGLGRHENHGCRSSWLQGFHNRILTKLPALASLAIDTQIQCIYPVDKS